MTQVSPKSKNPRTPNSNPSVTELTISARLSTWQGESDLTLRSALKYKNGTSRNVPKFPTGTVESSAKWILLELCAMLSDIDEHSSSALKVLSTTRQLRGLANQLPLVLSIVDSLPSTNSRRKITGPYSLRFKSTTPLLGCFRL